MTRRKKSSSSAYRQAEVVYTYEWPAVAGGKGFSKDAPYDTQLWDRMLMVGQNAASLFFSCFDLCPDRHTYGGVGEWW